MLAVFLQHVKHNSLIFAKYWEISQYSFSIIFKTNTFILKTWSRTGEKLYQDPPTYLLFQNLVLCNGWLGHTGNIILFLIPNLMLFPLFQTTDGYYFWIPHQKLNRH